MKISCNLLKKHIKNADSIDFLKIWDKFTIRTAEIENVEVKGADLKDVVVAEIIECVTHPKKDKYHILKVDNGTEIVDILCGAPNVRKGLKVCLVKPGGMVCGITIEPKEIAGILSQGMLCSGRELGISDNHEGILELPNDYLVGKSIKEYFPIDDIIVEIDNKSITHRPDLWGHYGIAREIAAITNHELIEMPLAEIPNTGAKLDIKILNSDLCPRYIGLKMDNISIKETPMDMQILLYYTGMRSISLLVDLTNYLMIEMGQPMHAFDARRVNSIEIGLANNKDKFTTLDGIERTLSHEDLMIKKNDEYFAIAGVMGGLDSEILPDTTSVILESANFDPFTVRKTAIRLGLRTDASAHYEKSLDPNMTEIATKRFVYLLEHIDPNMKIASKMTDVYPKPLKKGKIILNKSNIIKNIRENITDEEIKRILKSLSFEVKVLKDSFEVIVPTFRATKDITIEADLIEEIARIYGYENFKKEPLKVNMSFNDLNTPYKFIYKVKRYLATKYNMNEVHSYLWYKTAFLNRLKIEKENAKLLGKSEDNILRDDISLSLIEMAANNLKYYDHVKLFEVGMNIINHENKQVLSFVLGDNQNNLEKMYYEAKNVISNIFKSMKNVNIVFDKAKYEDYYNNDLSLKVIVNNKEIGKIKVFRNNLSTLLIKKRIFVVGEINIIDLYELNKEKILYKDVSKYPTVLLDYTIITDLNTKYDVIDKALNSYDNQLIIKYYLLDRFVSDKEIRTTIRYEIGSNDKTLVQNDLDAFKEGLIKHLDSNKLKVMQ